ncbi:MAG: YdjY domain-containing protein [Lentisphaeria bacterium]
MSIPRLSLIAAGLLLTGAAVLAESAPPADAGPFGGPPPRPAVTPGMKPTPLPAVEKLPNGDVRIGRVTVHPATREVSFPAVYNLKQGILEAVVATPEGRLHESLLRTEARPIQLQTALILLGLRNGARLPGGPVAQGDLVDMDLEWRRPDGTLARAPVEQWIYDNGARKSSPRFGWVFTGVTFTNGVANAEIEGNLVINYSVGDTVLDLPDAAGADDTRFVVDSDRKELAVGTPVRVILKPRAAAT